MINFQNHKNPNMNTEKSIEFTIIIIEDDIGLGKLIRRRLERENILAEVATSAEEAITKTTECANPILLLDYLIGNTSAIQFIKKLQVFGDLPPFIVMTGQGDETIAVEMMKIGALDYLVKDVHLIELLPDKIKQVCKEVVNKRTISKMEAELVRSGQEWKTTFDATNDAIFLLDENEIIIRCNKASEKIFQQDSQDIIGKTCCEIVHRTSEYEHKCPFDQIKKTFRREIIVVNYDEKILELTLDPIIDDSGNYLGGVHWIRDISDLKKKDESLLESQRQLKTLMSNLPGMAYRCKNDEHWTMEFVSDGCKNLTGYNSEDIIMNKIISYSDIIHHEDQKMVRETVNQALFENRQFQMTYRIILKENQLKWVWEQGRGIQGNQGELIALEGFITDITETKLASKALEESEEKFRLLATNASDMIYKMSLPDGKYEYVSPASEKLFGYTPEEFYDSPILIQKVIHPDWISYFEREWTKLIEGKFSPTYEYQIINKSGEVKWLYQTNVVLKDENDKPYAIQGIVSDITERKNAENELAESEEFLKTIYDNSELAIYVIKVHSRGNYSYEGINKQHEKIFGFTNSEIKGKTPDYVEEKLGRDVLDYIIKIYDECVTSKDIHESEFQVPDKNGRLEWWYSRLTPLLDSASNVYRIIGSSININDRKIYEEELVKSETRFRLLAQNAKLIPWEADAKTWDFTYVGEQAISILGYPVADWYKSDFWSKHIHLDDRDSTIDYCLKCSHELENYDFEYRMIAKDGRVVWFQDIVNVVKDKKGPKVLRGFMIDITERKIAEAKLRKSEKEFRLVTETIEDVFWMSTPGVEELIYISPAYEKLWGKSRESLYKSPTSFLDNFHPDDLERYKEVISEFHKNGKPYQCEYRISPKPDKELWIQERGYPVMNEENEVVHMTGICTDITQRMIFEAELEKSKIQLRDLVKHMNQIQENERIKISREIHDVVGQALTALNLDLVLLINKLNNEDDKMVNKLKNMVKLIDDTTKSTQKLSLELRPGLLDELGLKYAVDYLLKEFSERTGVKYEFGVSPSDFEISEELQITIYRIIQEALTNITRHAKATEIIIMLEKEHELVILSIKDNGIGIKEEDIYNPTSLGLLGMRERVYAHNGVIDIKGLENVGSTIKIEFKNNMR